MSFYTSNLTLNPIFQCIFDSEKPKKKSFEIVERKYHKDIFYKY